MSDAIQVSPAFTIVETHPAKKYAHMYPHRSWIQERDKAIYFEADPETDQYTIQHTNWDGDITTTHSVDIDICIDQLIAMELGIPHYC